MTAKELYCEHIQKSVGKALDGVTQLISTLLDIVIYIIEAIVTLVNSIGKGILGFLTTGGCLLLFLFTGPFGLLLLANPIVFLGIVFFVVFPILGTKFISFLKYVKYMITEYLFDYASYLMYGKNKRFNSFFEYGNKYKRAEEARKRKEQQERQARQQREWEERFRQWNEYQQHHRRSTGYGGCRYRGYGHTADIIATKAIQIQQLSLKLSERCCNILGYYDADKYQIKLAYRKKAKEYQSINKSPDAAKNVSANKRCLRI